MHVASSVHATPAGGVCVSVRGLPHTAPRFVPTTSIVSIVIDVPANGWVSVCTGLNDPSPLLIAQYVAQLVFVLDEMQRSVLPSRSRSSGPSSSKLLKSPIDRWVCLGFSSKTPFLPNRQFVDHPFVPSCTTHLSVRPSPSKSPTAMRTAPLASILKPNVWLVLAPNVGLLLSVY